MSTLVKKVISASAGTGKTYRLSLEYIALLLRCRGEGIHFSEILVITFTKKATAEIRERIFSHLQLLITSDPKASGLREHLAGLLGCPWQEADRTWLLNVYEEMLTNKSQVQINTIDSFINRLFKSVIAPFIGISGYSINSRMDPAYLASLYAYALEPDHLEAIKELFQRSKKRSLPDYQKLVEDLLGQRWLFHFIARDAAAHQPAPAAAAARLAEFTGLISAVLMQFAAYLTEDQPEITARNALTGTYFDLFFPDGEPEHDWIGILRTSFDDLSFLRENFRTLLKNLKFWNGSALLRKKKYAELAAELKDKLQLAQEALAEYLYSGDFLNEEAELARLAAILLRKYDELRFRDQIFGYDDIAWYTYRYLYDPELSLVEEDSVTNAFYEILANRVRFLLIDEFQDTSLLQFRILWPMIKEVISGEGVRPYGGVIVVGDEKQAIYGWRGGERDLLEAMETMLDQPERERLAVSYRSSPIIIDFVNALFGGEALQQRLAMRGLHWRYEACQAQLQGQSGGIFVCLRACGGDEEENDLTSLRDACEELVKTEIQPRLREGTIHPGQTAILARENRDLRALADILDELEIDYVLDSSHSLLEHRAIKPALYLLRYMATRDFDELLKFLRSDYLLIGAKELKSILLAYRAAAVDPAPLPLWRKLAADLPQLTSLQRCCALLEAAPELDLLSLCKRIFEEFAVPELFAQENDSKNIVFFLELVAGFCQDQREFPPTPAGFIRYCEMHQDDEAWQQLGLEEVDAIRLLTVHKSKGLEFDSVFLFWPLTRHRDEQDRLHHYVLYDDRFERIREFALTFNYNDVLAASSRRELVEQSAARECIEELNAFYVAVTRARRHLGIYLTGRSSKGLNGLLERSAEKERPSAMELILATLHEQLSAQGLIQTLRPEGADARWGEWQGLPQPSAAATAAMPAGLAGYFDPGRTSWYKADPERIEKERFLDYKSVYVNKRLVDRGNVVHYYLAQIISDSPEARANALARTLGDFGSLVPAAEIRRIIARVEAFLDAHASWFSAAEWDHIFTELTLYAQDGREQRIDRMLVNTSRREILIIDYKTGENRDPAQLEAYRCTVAALPHVRSGGYAVNGLFLDVELEEG